MGLPLKIDGGRWVEMDFIPTQMHERRVPFSEVTGKEKSADAHYKMSR